VTPSLRMLSRDWRAGELARSRRGAGDRGGERHQRDVLADRVSRGLARDAHQLLGADLVLVSDHPWKAEVANEMVQQGLQGARGVNFIRLVTQKDQSALAA